MSAQLSFADTGEGIAGEAMVAMADKWVRDNPDAWREMGDMASGLASEGRRFSMETLVQEARYSMRTKGFSQGFKVNNNMRSALARRLVRERPECGKFVEMRGSKVDWL